MLVSYNAYFFIGSDLFMSKIYNKYLELKKENDDKFYLFKCGNFYIFLDEDAERINEYVVYNSLTCDFVKMKI